MKTLREAYTLWALFSSISDAVFEDYIMHDLIPRQYKMATELNLAVISETPETIEASAKVIKETGKAVNEMVPSLLELLVG